MFKKLTQPEPERIGTIAELRAEATRKAQALVSEPGSLYSQYEAYQNQLSGLLQASSDLSQPIDADVTRESTITALRRRLLALEPLLGAERAVREQAHTEYQAADKVLRTYEHNAVLIRQELANFDHQTRKICAERDYWRQLRAAELARLIGGPIVIPEPLQLDKIT